MTTDRSSTVIDATAAPRDREVAPADLSHYRAVHDRMRVDIARFASAVDTAVAGDRRGRLQPLARWAKGFAHELHLHHTIEDDVLFPDLVARVPTAGEVLAGLEADHVVVADLLERWAPAADRLADGRAPFAAARSEMLDLAVTLRDLLARHLDVEDEQILPLFDRHYSAEDFEALTQRAAKQLPKRGLSFSLPWNVSTLPADTAAEMLRTAPMPLRVLHRLTRPRLGSCFAARCVSASKSSAE
jgi:hemerythrin-like domain-containing protein